MENQATNSTAVEQEKPKTVLEKVEDIISALDQKSAELDKKKEKISSQIQTFEGLRYDLANGMV